MGLDMFSQFHFLRPWWLMMILPVVFFLRHFFGNRKLKSKWRGVIAAHLLDHLIVSEREKKRLKPTHMLLAGSVLASLVMAGPTWERGLSPFAEDQAPLAVVLDLSQSMDQTDIRPSRLERAKQKINDLLDIRKGSKTGIIAFAGTSHMVIPLTNDPQVIENLLFAVKTEMMPRPGKAMEKALPLIQTMFEEPGVPGTILLITDGVSPGSTAPFARYLKSSGHQLIVYAMGRNRQSHPENNNSDVLGGAFIPLAQKELEAFAKACKGIYQEATPDKSDIQRISRRIDFNFISAKDQTRPWIDSGYYLLFPMAAIFVLWFRKGWTLTWGIACIMTAVFAGPRPAAAADALLTDLWLTPDQQGRYFFEKGDYEKAANRFEDILWKGTAFYMNENFEAAIELFLQIKTPDGYFNLGNAYAHARQYGKSLDAYHRALAQNPDHADAKKNIRIISGIIDEIMQTSANQKSEPGQAVEELGDDLLKTADADLITVGPKDVAQYSAKQILNNPELSDIWMRQVQQDPARFLRLKFQMQLNSQAQEDIKAHGE